MEKQNYLNRINFNEKVVSPDLNNLKLLQRRHLLHVPFENLDIHWKRKITLDAENFYKKIIGEKRGGFCYELNGLFYELLSEIGYESKIISARVANKNGGFGVEFDHLTILTKIGGAEYLVDVGFGDFTAEPLKFVLNIEQNDANGIFLIRKYDEEYFEVAKKDGENWKSEFIFKDLPRNLSEFTEMCGFHQTSPESHFTRGKVCSIMTETGRKTLTDNKFMKTENGRKRTTDINSDKEFAQILFGEFDIKSDF